MIEQLTARKEKILSFIIGSYIDSVTPVSSRTIARRFGLGLSPATIRNEMSDLEEMGFISQPHTSAGRVPTDKGYRYYVDKLALREKISTEVLENIKSDFAKRMRNLDELIERTSRILSSVTNQAGIVFYPHLEELTFRHVDLIDLGSGRLLSVWLTPSGFVKEYFIEMGEAIGSDELKNIASFLNQELAGVSFGEMEEVLARKREETSDSLIQLYQRAQKVLRESIEQALTERFSLEGSSLILGKPEFQDIEKTRLIFQALDDKKRFASLFQFDTETSSGVRVHIGGETRCEDLWDCSLITSRYEFHHAPVGSLGIIGPRRMPYGRLIPIVDYISHQFATALEHWF